MSISTWFAAAKTGDCRFLLQHKASFAKQTEAAFPNNTALITATISNQTLGAKLLIQLERGLTNKNGLCALHFAVLSGNISLVKLLAPFESQLRTRSQYKQIPPNSDAAQIAAMTGQHEILQLISPNYSYLFQDWSSVLTPETDELKRTKLHYYIFSNIKSFSDPQKMFLQKVDSQGMTALMLAAQAGCLEAVKHLLDESTLQSLTGATALHLAVENSHFECAKILLTKEAKIQNQIGFTALHIAAKNGNLEMVKLLEGAESGVVTSKQHLNFAPGTTALMLAAFYEHKDIVEELKEVESQIVNEKGQKYDQIGVLSEGTLTRGFRGGRELFAAGKEPEVVLGDFSAINSSMSSMNASNARQVVNQRQETNIVVGGGENIEQLFKLQSKLSDAKVHMAKMKANIEFNDREVQELRDYLHLKNCHSCDEKHEKIQLQELEINGLKQEIKELRVEIKILEDRNIDILKRQDKQAAFEFHLDKIQTAISTGSFMKSGARKLYEIEKENKELYEANLKMEAELISLRGGVPTVRQSRSAAHKQAVKLVEPFTEVEEQEYEM